MKQLVHVHAEDVIDRGPVNRLIKKVLIDGVDCPDLVICVNELNGSLNHYIRSESRAHDGEIYKPLEGAVEVVGLTDADRVSHRDRYPHRYEQAA